METIQKRFSYLGMVLTLIIVIGLMIQYMYLNKIVTKEKQINLITIREHLAEDINCRINSYNQYVNIAADTIGSNGWTDDQVADYLNRLAEGSSVIKSIHYGDQNNKIINSGSWEPPGDYDLKTRSWYIEAAQKGELVISDVYGATMDRSTVMAISKPVYDKDKTLLGVVAADIALDEIIKKVERTKVQGSGYSFLIDENGTILAHPKYKYNLGSGLINIDSIGSEIHKEIKNIKMGQIKTELDGVEGYLSYRPIEDTNWIIGNFISLQEFKGGNSDLWRMFFIALNISIVIFLSFTLIQKKSFLIPLLRLDEDIGKINVENNITYRIPLSIKDPFKKIKVTLNFALSKTQDLVEQVERDRENMSIQNTELNYLSYNDQLTGIYNRRYFEKQLVELDIQENLPITLVMGDANGLKLINDSFGHEAGDNLLISIANIIKKGCRAGDVVSRISGDEFVIILPKTDQDGAKLIVERIQQLSDENKVITKKFSNIEISVSYGFATKYDMTSDILETLKKAEDGMYSNKLFEGPEMRKRTMQVILKELYRRDKNKESHFRGVAAASRNLGMELGMKEEELQELVRLGEVHDIGEIVVGEEILSKRGELINKEWIEVKKHPEIGYRILSTIGDMSNLAYYTLSHHERYDGIGYPKGLKGEDIPLASRILTIADAYDAMISERPYKKALSKDEVIREFIENAGTQFDPKLAKVFVEKVLESEWII